MTYDVIYAAKQIVINARIVGSPAIKWRRVMDAILDAESRSTGTIDDEIAFVTSYVARTGDLPAALDALDKRHR